MSTLVEIAEALAAALQPLRDEIEDLQIYPYFLLNPTPPAIDIYPGDPFQTGSGFDPAEKNLYWTIRARWTTADHDASQQGLLSLLDPSGLEAALYTDDTLGGVVDDVAVTDDSPTGYREYVADMNGRLLGAEWRVQVIMSANGAAPPVEPSGPVLLDNFDRANSGDLGASWARVTALGANRLAVNGNTAKAVGGTYADAWTADLLTGDHEVTVTLKTVDTGAAHIWLLLQVPNPAAADFTGYLLDIVTGFTDCNVTVYRGNSGSYTTVGSATGLAYATNDVWTLRKTGAALSVLRNGTPVSGFPATDPAPLTADGYAGIGGSGSTTATLDDFTAGATT